MTQNDIINLATHLGAVTYSPPPLRAVRGMSFTFEQLEKFCDAIAEEAYDGGYELGYSHACENERN